MQRILDDLRKIRYLQRIVVALGRASDEQYQHVLRLFSDFYTPVSILHIESDNIQGLLRLLEDRGLPIGPDEKAVRVGCHMGSSWPRATALVCARADGFRLHGVHERQDEQVEHAAAQHIAERDVRQRGECRCAETGEQLREARGRGEQDDADPASTQPRFSLRARRRIAPGARRREQ